MLTIDKKDALELRKDADRKRLFCSNVSLLSMIVGCLFSLFERSYEITSQFY